jgi:hypothetical protein
VRFPELRKKEFEQFLDNFARQGSLKFRNNKWIGLSKEGKPFTVHVKHGTTRKYPPALSRMRCERSWCNDGRLLRMVWKALTQDLEVKPDLGRSCVLRMQKVREALEILAEFGLRTTRVGHPCRPLVPTL